MFRTGDAVQGYQTAFFKLAERNLLTLRKKAMKYKVTRRYKSGSQYTELYDADEFGAFPLFVAEFVRTAKPGESISWYPKRYKVGVVMVVIKAISGESNA